MARSPSRTPHYDLNLVRQAASGRWPEILSSLGGIVIDLLDGQHHACPRCGGTDRFRFSNLNDGGSVLCNKCFNSKNGDGFAAIQWLRGWTFQQSLHEIGSYLGISPESNGQTRQAVDPAKHLRFIPWNDLLVTLWCEQKRPISAAAIQAIGGRLARYRSEYTVIALPVLGQQFDRDKPVGWVLYNTSGKPLPTYGKQGNVTGWVKIKTTAGSQPGIIGPPESASSATIWKTEGPSDLLALLSLELPPGQSAICNAMGSKEDPLRITWLTQLVAGRTVYVIHDCDTPGQEGGARWSAAIAGHAAECRAVTLPYPIAETHGKDLRDWLAEGHTYQELTELAERSQIVQKKDSTPKTLESDDDPNRLARVNLERFSRLRDGGTLACWRDEWYKWTVSAGCWRKIGEEELKSKVWAAVKEEFDRINIEKLEEYEEQKKAGQIDPDTDKGPPHAKKVSKHLVGNVLAATSSMCVVDDDVEWGMWIDETGSRKTSYLAMRNGILDLEALISGSEDCLRPHSKCWWSPICLPYDFDPEADCPRFKQFLNNNLEGDQERIELLQQWVGHLLTPCTDYQKFLFLEGEGANGKSVFLSVVRAVLGDDNCSSVDLELFGQPFMLTETLGKLVNIASECSEMDSVAEGYLKAFTDGSPMLFNRKRLQPIQTRPTARLMVAANVRPRFSDKSSAMWRRIIVMPWRIKIAEADRVIGMDKVEWWVASGELPGVLNWAVAGLADLREKRRFRKSKVCEQAIKDYRFEVNPAKRFILDNCMEGSSDDSIKTSEFYKEYHEWAETHGYKPLSDGSFGKEVLRQFATCKRERRRDAFSPGSRCYYYTGIVRGSPPDEEEEF